jgi:hypothetical protein
MWTIQDNNTHRIWRRWHCRCEILALDPLATAGALPSDGHRQIRHDGPLMLSAQTGTAQADPDRVADALAQLLAETAVHAEAIAAPVAEAAELAPWLDAETARRKVV